VTNPPVWDENFIFNESNKPQITVKKPILIDVGALGKGYLIDIVGQILEENGIHSYCIDAGGDILHRNTDVLRIGLENPENIDQAIGIALIKNQSLCGSAGNRRVWAHFHHIINPHTLLSPRHILATWVVGQTTILADGLATALFFVTPQDLLAHFNFEYVIVYADGHAEISTGFPGELF
jgi:thiamine biosynthesis lipoprotein